MSVWLPHLATDWLHALSEQAQQKPVSARQPIWAGSQQIGSLAVASLAQWEDAGLRIGGLGWRAVARDNETGWQLPQDPTTCLHALGQSLRALGLVKAPRDERLDVTDAQGHRRGSVTRDLARLLGLTTHSVHLVGLTKARHCWVQQRALDKAEDPGLWDTLVGATVSEGESESCTLGRELWEEAGLRPDALSPWVRCGEIVISQPRGSDGLGWQVERIGCYRAEVAPEREPCNQDGEVMGFECLGPEALAERLQANRFTLEAASVLCQVDRLGLA